MKLSIILATCSFSKSMCFLFRIGNSSVIRLLGINSSMTTGNFAQLYNSMLYVGVVSIAVSSSISNKLLLSSVKMKPSLNWNLFSVMSAVS